MNTQPFSETGCKLSGCGFEQVAVTYTSDIAPVSSKEFHDNKATIECRFTIKRVRGTIRTYRKNLYFFLLIQNGLHCVNVCKNCNESSCIKPSSC